MAPKAQVIPPGAASEPSEPSQIKPEDKSKKQITSQDEENPQVVVQKPGKQYKDRGEKGTAMKEGEIL
ncbi:hypothetical protein EIP91_004288 [Steccherinum ochraceum]|uniref:Uncharacterized protein n=1 Tax=Steccherinum ochraceum TaxID=92696 RepID=A0A4R0R913_9APHY|nr:hypothetical protein EIP91_004288 [Steccherinum ochraceum]